MVTMGRDARYLCDVCAGKPPPPQLKRQRNHLLAGRDPYSGLPLSQPPSLVGLALSSAPPGSSSEQPVTLKVSLEKKSLPDLDADGLELMLCVSLLRGHDGNYLCSDPISNYFRAGPM